MRILTLEDCVSTSMLSIGGTYVVCSVVYHCVYCHVSLCVLCVTVWHVLCVTVCDVRHRV